MRMVADRFKFTCHMLISLTTILILAKHSCSGPLSPTLHSTPLYTISQVGSYSSDPDRENCLHALSKKVAIVANIPIFEFREEITKILEMAEIDKGLIDPSTIIDLELIFYDYMAKLRSYYYLVFINYRRIAISDFIIPSRLDLTEERDHCLGECRKAMEAAVPSLGMAESWNFQGCLLELESDIDALIEDAMSNLPTDDQEYEVCNDSKRVIKRKLFLKRIWKRLRWVSVQCALLMFNFAQTEWNRRSSKHLADRRLAEVPEFPLL